MMLIDEIAHIVNDRKNLQRNLFGASQAVKDILFFAFGDHDIDLPSFEPKDIGDLPRSEISSLGPRGDILRQESSKLLKLFSKQHSPEISRQRRIQMFKDIFVRCTDNGRVLLLEIVRDRRIGNLTRQDVAAVYGEEFFAARSLPGAAFGRLVNRSTFSRIPSARNGHAGQRLA